MRLPFRALLPLVVLFIYADDLTMSTSIHLIDRKGKRPAQENVFVPFNSHVTLSCKPNDKDVQLQWEQKAPAEHAFIPVQETPFVSIGLTKDKALNLQFSKMRLGSTVAYRCRGPSSSQTVQLQVVGAIGTLPTVVPIKTKAELVGTYNFIINYIDVRVKPTLQCYFAVGINETNHTAVRWSGGLYESQPEMYEVSETKNEGTTSIIGFLKILKIVLDPSIFGQYKCDLYLRGSPIESLYVQLSVPPIIRNPVSLISLYPGEEFVFTCDVFADPDIDGFISWAKDRTLIDWKTAPGRLRVRTRVFPNDEIQIFSVQQSDRGVYSCFVDSESGNATGVAYLKVKDRLSFLIPAACIIAQILFICGVLLIPELGRKKRLHSVSNMSTSLP